MGAITSNRKRRGDCFNTLPSVSPPIYPQSDAPVFKKPKLSVPSMSTPDFIPVSSSSSSVSARLSAYPKTKPRVLREPHAPVGNSKFSWEGLSGRRKKLFGLQQYYAARKDDALGSLRYHKKDGEVLLGEDKGKEVIQIDDDEEKVDVFDDSSVEEVDIFERKDSRERSVKRLDKEFGSLDSSVVSDVSNVAEKTDLVVLDGGNEDGGNENMYKKLYKNSQKRNGKLKNVQFEIELAEKRRQWSGLLRSQTKPKEVKKDRVEECFIPLTEEEESEVADALYTKQRKKILVSHENSNIDISGEKLQCLRPGMWLNDEVINVYLELLKEREKREPQKFLKCHFFNTFFYKKLIGRGGYNYQQVRRWTSQKKLGYSLLECDKIFVPIHQEIHWCLGIINKKEEKFQYLDSLRGRDPQVLDVMLKYYIDEVKDKNGKEIDVSAWNVEYVTDLPEQENGFDCGMFMIKYADFYSRDLGLCFGQENMPYFRKRTAKELLRLRAD